MFLWTLGVFILCAVLSYWVLIQLYDIHKDSEAEIMVILAGGGFWLIALKMAWDYMWFVF